MPLQIPGQTPISYFEHPRNSPIMLQSSINGPNGPEIHTAGGFTKIEHVAIELARSACQGCANDESDSEGVNPEALGVWAARTAAALLGECAAIERAIEQSAAAINDDHEPRQSTILQP